MADGARGSNIYRQPPPSSLIGGHWCHPSRLSTFSPPSVGLRRERAGEAGHHFVLCFTHTCVRSLLYGRGGRGRGSPRTLGLRGFDVIFFPRFSSFSPLASVSITLSGSSVLSTLVVTDQHLRLATGVAQE